MMAEEYEIPVDFKDDTKTAGKIATTTTSSVASSSRMASAASAPVNSGGSNRNAAAVGTTSSVGGADPRFGGDFDRPSRQNKNNAEDSGSTTVDGNSFHSSPLMWSGSTPQQMKSRRELERKLRRRSQVRNVRHPRGAMPKQLPTGDGKKEKDEDASAPLPKVLTDILLQTAMLGIGTTAKLSGPTLELTKNTLLPQIIMPLLEEIWEMYTPIRLRTWTKVVPTSLKNLGNLLWDTEAGQELGKKAGRLGENAVDVASSEAARQCWIDATVALIKLMESLHTPEVKALLNQFAVGACRFVDALSSGKAKQVWFDVADAAWALIEVGSDPVMVSSLAEGCAQICFALERERESLKQRRSKGAAGVSAAAAGSDSKVDGTMASQRRRERDRRQMVTYPPGKKVVSEAGGRDGFHDALLDGLDEDIGRQEENQREFDDQVYSSIDNIAEDGGPPQRVMVPTSTTENIGGDKRDLSEEAADNNQVEAADPPHVINDDDESEITTEIEDLQCGDDPVEFDDVHTQISASEKGVPNAQDDALTYEQDGNVDNVASLEQQTDQLDRRPNDDGTASEMYDAFEEPILQFYRRLNEVLVETRKQDKFHMQRTSRRGTDSIKGKGDVETDGNSTSGAVAERCAFSPREEVPISAGLFGIQKKWWKLIIIASVCGIATMCMIWFALGCYGLYMLFMGGGRIYPHPPPQNTCSNHQVMF